MKRVIVIGCPGSVKTTFVYRTKVVSFLAKSHLIGMKSLRDEIRLRREIGTDLISSAKQISLKISERKEAPRS